MVHISKTQVPSTMAEDCNQGKSVWLNGRLISLDEGTHVTYYIGHETIEQEEDGKSATAVAAFAVRVAKPVSRDMAINAAEMSAYGLRTAMEVASFNASMGRKHRDNPNDPEVRDHDEFIAWAKEQLSAIGV